MTIRKKVLSYHQRSTLIFTDAKEQIHHLRISSTLEVDQKSIYEALYIKNTPKRQHKIHGTLQVFEKALVELITKQDTELI